LTIYWGFKFQETNLQPVAIFKDGKPRLLAVVDEVVRLADGDRSWISSLQQYKDAIKESGVTPTVDVFVRKAEDLSAYLPYLKRWLQADLLGFNANCGQVRMAPACTLAERIELPIQGHLLSRYQGTPQPLPIPSVTAAAVPLVAFRQ